MNLVILLAVMLLGMGIGTFVGYSNPRNRAGYLMLFVGGIVGIMVFSMAANYPERFGIEGLENIFGMMRYLAAFFASQGFFGVTTAYMFGPSFTAGNKTLEDSPNNKDLPEDEFPQFIN